MDAQALLLERKQLFDNVIKFKHNPRVPTSANFFTWKYLAAGYNLNVALRDYSIMEKVNSDFHQTYRFDAYSDIGWRNSVRVSDALGGHFHYVDETGQFVQADDRCVIELDEMLEALEDPLVFNWTKALPRYAKAGLTLKELGEAVAELAAFGQFTERMDKLFLNEFGALQNIQIATMVSTPLENFFNFQRGIKQTALDIRKNKSQVIEIMDRMFEVQCKPVLESSLSNDNKGFVAQIQLAFLGHSILSASQFGELYWPYVKQVIDFSVANDKAIYVFCEAEMLRFAEYFEDVPKGTLLIHVEQDDIFEFRRRLPNIAVVGGMPTSLLYGGTQKQCVDYAKHLIDELGEGYVFSQDKMMSYINDAKPENVLATQDFVLNYSY